MRIALCCLFNACLLLGPSAASWAEANGQSTPRNSMGLPKPSGIRLPFGFQLGRTTLAEAEAKWRELGVQNKASGYLALGTGSGVDGGGSVAGTKVRLVDIANVDFEGVRTVRFGFYDEVLYLVQARLRDLMKDNMGGDKPLNEKELKALEDTLRKHYGASPRALRSPYSSKPDVFVWTFGNDELTLSTSPVRSALIAANKPLREQAASYRKALCAKERARGKSCW
jgi:hypothetical protein